MRSASISRILEPSPQGLISSAKYVLYFKIDPFFSAISARMIDRIFSGAVTRGAAQQEGKMSYTEFVWFLLAEEDKRAATSIEYW